MIYESTVYPGVTEDICLPILEEYSSLTCGANFHLAFSPERINPGDQLHQMRNVVKLISGQTKKSLDKVKDIYSKVFNDKIYICPSIKVAESSKLLENTQRDLNIALVNEFSYLAHKLDINIQDILAAAKTKWNFMDVKPGFPGGECIPIDPYYYIFLANQFNLRASLASNARDIIASFNYLEGMI